MRGNRVLLLLGIVAGCALVLAHPAAAEDPDRAAAATLQALVKRADLLVVVTPRLWKAKFLEVTVDAVYQGPLHPGDSVRISFPMISDAPQGLALNDAIHRQRPVMCFLSTHGNEYRLTFYDFYDFPRSGMREWRNREFAWVRVSDPRPKGRFTPVEGALAELRAGLSSPEAVVVESCISWLTAIKEPYARQQVLAARPGRGEGGHALRIHQARYQLEEATPDDTRTALRYLDELIRYTKATRQPDNKRPFTPDKIRAMIEYSLHQKWAVMLMSAFGDVKSGPADGVRTLNQVMVSDGRVRIPLMRSAQYWANDSSLPALMEVFLLKEPYRPYIKVVPTGWSGTHVDTVLARPITRWDRYECLKAVHRLTGRKIPPHPRAFDEQYEKTMTEWRNWWQRRGGAAQVSR